MNVTTVAAYQESSSKSAVVVARGICHEEARTHRQIQDKTTAFSNNSNKKRVEKGKHMMTSFSLAASAYVFGLVLTHLMELTCASDALTRSMYTIRAPVESHRRAVELIDIGSFLLTNSEDGRPKAMTPFYLNVFETQEELSAEALKSVEDATSDFLIMELNSIFFKNSVASVRTLVVAQEKIEEQVDNRRLSQGMMRGRTLRAVAGSKFELNVNVTFDSEPSPDAVEVDMTLQHSMKDLTQLVQNLTASEDPELAYVFMAYREELSSQEESTQPPDAAAAPEGTTSPPEVAVVAESTTTPPEVAVAPGGTTVSPENGETQPEVTVAPGSETTLESNPTLEDNKTQSTSEIQPTLENPTKGENTATVDGIQKPIPQQNRGGQSMKFVIPIMVALVLIGAILALFTIRRRRRRVQAANQKVQEDLAFLDEESNVFSFENSPSKSSTRNMSVLDAKNGGYDDDGGYSESQGSSLEPTSPSYAMIGGLGSPQRSSLSGASTVKVSNARLMPLPSKLTELGSNSLFAFSEEDEEYDSSIAENSQKTPLSVQQSVASNGSSFNRIMSDKSDEEGISSIENSPRHSIASPVSSTANTADQQGSSKTTIASFLSAHFFSGGDSVSQFAGSALTVQAANTTEAVQKKAAAKNVRSFSLSPQKRSAVSPALSVQSRAKSETEGGEDDDSVFDFASPKTKCTKLLTVDGALKQDQLNDIDMESLNDALEDAAPPDATNESIAKGVISPVNPPKQLANISLTLDQENPPSQSGTPHSQNRVGATNDEENESIDDSLSFSDAPGSFPRRSRRHAKSTTHDGTTAYQTNAMQPQDWSMTDGLSDDDTLSEQGGGASFGAFPKSGFRSPKSAPKKPGHPKSPSSQSKSSFSAAPNSPASKTDDASQASASRQLINDLVWLSKKIAGVKQSTVESAPGESALGPALAGAPPMIETVDSLSYASQDGLISPTSRPDSVSKQGTPLPQAPGNKSSNIATSISANANANTSIVCQDCYAPPGKLNIVIHSTKDGPAVHEVKSGSCLEGRIYPGDLIISVDEADTRAFTAAQLMKMMAEKGQSERKITVLHFDETEASVNSDA